MGIFKGIIIAWKLLRVVRTQIKLKESDADAYFTEERALELRFKGEQILHALASGNGNFAKLPKWVKWLLGVTTIDNRIGKFGQWFLKSEKLETGDKALEQPLYRTH